MRRLSSFVRRVATTDERRDCGEGGSDQTAPNEEKQGVTGAGVVKAKAYLVPEKVPGLLRNVPL
jgi:hypothetical protein